jgi:hypothetical protein
LQKSALQAVIDAKPNIFAETPARTAREFPLDPSHADSRSLPLRAGRNVKQVTQVVPSWSSPLLSHKTACAFSQWPYFPPTEECTGSSTGNLLRSSGQRLDGHPRLQIVQVERELARHAQRNFGW